MNPYIYPLSFQTVLPENYKTDQTFISLCSTMQTLGFWGIELNMERYEEVAVPDLISFLDQYGLTLSMFASGLTAKSLGLSLSSADPTVRHRTVEVCKKMIDFWSGLSVGIIFGFMKGGPVPQVQEARDLCAESLDILAPYAADKKVVLILEATNRYETSVANSLEDSLLLVQKYQSDYVQILPDTYHMNIEEADLYGAMKTSLPHFSSFHLSDNNRFFPGFGAMPFEKIVTHLQSIGYDGKIAIEGNIKVDVESDLNNSIKYLAPILGS